MRETKAYFYHYIMNNAEFHTNESKERRKIFKYFSIAFMSHIFNHKETDAILSDSLDSFNHEETRDKNYISLPSIFVSAPYSSTPINVEVSMRKGLPTVRLAGFHSSHVFDTIERIKNALYTIGDKIPSMSFLISLSPVDIKKFGAYLDLSIIVAFLRILRLRSQEKSESLLFPPDVFSERTLYIGELSLSGQIRQIPQILSILWEAKKCGFQHIVLPAGDIHTAQIISGLSYYPIETINDLFLKMSRKSLESQSDLKSIRIVGRSSRLGSLEYDRITQRAIALSTSGWHSSLLIGPPGCGKSSFAREVAALLPPPEQTEIIEILISNPNFFADLRGNSILQIERPIRSPHHSSTRRALIGGGMPIYPGEITLANHGVLILDEISEFSREALNALREPLEQREIHLSKGKEQIILPARFLLCASANPCPCGSLENRPHCSCTDHSLRKYNRRFAGALRNRIDIVLEMKNKMKKSTAYTESELKKMITNASQMQKKRFLNTKFKYNSDIPLNELDQYIPFADPEAVDIWLKIQKFQRFSYRVIASIRRMSRTLADMEQRKEVSAEDLIEACSFKAIEMDYM